MATRTADRSDIHPGCRALREQAQAEGVEHPANLPYLLVPDGATTAVLLVHGFTASPQEMRLLAEVLVEAGFAALAVRLPGHGTCHKDLSRRKWGEWAEAVAAGHRLLAESFTRVYGIGLSTGSLLLVNQTLNQPLDGMVLLSPYLRVKHRLAAFAGWLKHLRPYHEHPDPGPPSPFYYRKRPVAGVHQINRLVSHLKPQLSRCLTPTLAINGEGDQTVQIASGRQLVEQLGSPVKIYQRHGPQVPHILTSEQNPLYREMFDMIVGFIKELDEPGGMMPSAR